VTMTCKPIMPGLDMIMSNVAKRSHALHAANMECKVDSKVVTLCRVWDGIIYLGVQLASEGPPERLSVSHNLPRQQSHLLKRSTLHQQHRLQGLLSLPKMLAH